MNEPDAAGEQVAETEPGIDQKQFGSHLGHMDPDQEPDGGSEEVDQEQKAEEGGETPAPGEETAETKPDDDALQRKVGELAFENRQLKRQLEQRPQEQPPDGGQPEPLKTLKDFEYDEQAFNAYLVEEGAKRGEQRARAAQFEERSRTEADKKADEFAAREDAFEAESPGFKERMHDENLRISEEMALFIVDSANEVGLHVGDFLGKNPTEAARIAGLPSAQQMREMVKLETKVSKNVAKAKAEKEKASQAPPPPSTTVDGEDPGIGDVDPTSAKSDDLSDEEWARQRNKQLKAKRK